MDYFTLSLLVVIGLCIGSFANVCIFRLPRECLSPFRGFSFCPLCLNTIKWYDNIPLLSYLILKGKCRFCHARISIRYPLIELLFGIISPLLYHYYNTNLHIKSQGIVAFAVLFFLVFVIIVSSIIDLKYRIIPDELTVGGLIVGLILSPFIHIYGNSFYVLPALNVPDTILRIAYSVTGAIVGGGLLYFIGVVGELIFKKEAMGFGDVKFMAMFGSYLGWQLIIISFLAACFVGSIIGIIYFVITKDHYIPFGPFLSCGLLFSIFSNEYIIHFLQNIWKT
ncbi:MAG: prepilin peptidase [Planctomycetota bacterium]